MTEANIRLVKQAYDAFLRWRAVEMPNRYEQGEARRKAGTEHPAQHDPRGRLVAAG